MRRRSVGSVSHRRPLSHSSPSARKSPARAPIIVCASPPLLSATAWLVSVGIRPAPSHSVGRYCAMLTEKPTARAVSSGRVSEGRVNSQKIRVGPQPSVRAITVIRGSRWRQAGRKINSIHGTTHSRWPHRTVHHSPSSQAYSASRY